MGLTKTHKTKKSKTMIGRKMGTHGSGARKNKRKSGNRGGKGMSGSGKRADHKKTLVTKLYGHGYFGKSGITSKGTKRDTRQRINLEQIQANLKTHAKKTAKGFEVMLKNYKILGEGEIKEKLIITCLEASKSAQEKVKKAGGEIILLRKKREKVSKKQDKTPSQ
jgi:large subunit ribosomal protein L15